MVAGNILNCPFIPVAKRIASHRGAQGVMYGDMIRQAYGQCDVNYGGEIEEHNDYDTMWVYHGNDFSGGLNMFGGVYGFPYVKNTVNFSQFKGKIKSIAIDFPPYHEWIKDKLDKAKKDPQPEWADVDLDNLERMHKEAETIIHPNPTNKIVIGDSHSICMYRPGWTIKSIPFKTLNGILKEGISNYIPDEGANYNEIELYFGNIDIRHHIVRLDVNVKELADRYIEQAKELDAKIYELLPIENESRKLPQSGYYKGKPFWGTWQERNDARNAFNDYIDSKYGIIRWTDKLLNAQGELDFDCMEKPKSIHLSREHYPYWNGVEPDAMSQSLESFFG